jgi:hypothetical protein
LAAARDPEALWIEKPRARARGEGVRLLQRLSEAKRDKTTLVQQYLSRPHLIDGFKYSLRFYVLVTSVRPLVAWIYGDGFCKLASRPFSLAPADRADRFRHLTNPDVLKLDKETPVSSRNTTHTTYRARLPELGLDAETLWPRIHALAARTMAAAQGPICKAMDAAKLTQDGCFEPLGFDVSVDADGRPWLLEVNISPSLAVHADATEKAREEMDLKRSVMEDAFRLIDLDEELPPAPAFDAPPAQWEKRYQALHERRGGFAPLVPGPEGLSLLSLIDHCQASDLALALHGRSGSARRLKAHRARGLALDRHLVVQADEVPELMLLDSEVAHVWRAAEQGGSPEECAEALARAEPSLTDHSEQLAYGVLAAWAHERAVGLADAAEPPLAMSVRGKGEHLYELHGLRFTLLLADAKWLPLVAPTLPWAARHGGRAPDASFGVRSDCGALVIEDERGYQQAVPDASQLAAAVHEMVARRATLRSGLIGGLDAPLVRRGNSSAIVVGMPADVKSALAPRFVLVASHPGLFGKQGAPLQVLTTVSQLSRAHEVAAVIELRVASDLQPGMSSMDRSSALEKLLGCRLQPRPAISAASAEALVQWLGARACLRLAARSKDEALSLLQLALEAHAPVPAVAPPQARLG